MIWAIISIITMVLMIVACRRSWLPLAVCCAIAYSVCGWFRHSTFLFVIDIFIWVMLVRWTYSLAQLKAYRWAQAHIDAVNEQFDAAMQLVAELTWKEKPN